MWKGLALSLQYLEKIALFDANLHICCNSKVEENDWWLRFRARIMMNNARNGTQHWVRIWIYLSCIRTLTEMSIYFLDITTLGNVFTSAILWKNKRQLFCYFYALVCLYSYISEHVYTQKHPYIHKRTNNFMKPNLTACSSLPICKVYWRNKKTLCA